MLYLFYYLSFSGDEQHQDLPNINRQLLGTLNKGILLPKKHSELNATNYYDSNPISCF